VGGVEPHQKLEVTNAGPGPAVGTAYFGVDAGRKFGGFIARTTLLAGERSKVVFPAVYIEGQSVEFVLWCRDLRDSIHVWSHHGGYARLTPKPEHWPGDRELFHRFYSTEIPEGPITTFATE
jgi:hypothetical protein